VMNMAVDENDAVIVRSTIELGHNLGLEVVAEGVESEEIWRELARLGCDLAQGYYLSRPMQAEALASWLAGIHPLSRADLPAPVRQEASPHRAVG